MNVYIFPQTNTINICSKTDETICRLPLNKYKLQLDRIIRKQDLMISEHHYQPDVDAQVMIYELVADFLNTFKDYRNYKYK